MGNATAGIKEFQNFVNLPLPKRSSPLCLVLLYLWHTISTVLEFGFESSSTMTGL